MTPESLYSSARMTMRTDKSFFTVALWMTMNRLSYFETLSWKIILWFNFDEESDEFSEEFSIYSIYFILLKKTMAIIYVDGLKEVFIPKTFRFVFLGFYEFHKGHKRKLSCCLQPQHLLWSKSFLDVMEIYGLLKEMQCAQRVMFIRWISSKMWWTMGKAYLEVCYIFKKVNM